MCVHVHIQIHVDVLCHPMASVSAVSFVTHLCSFPAGVSRESQEMRGRKRGKTKNGGNPYSVCMLHEMVPVEKCECVFLLARGCVCECCGGTVVVTARRFFTCTRLLAFTLNRQRKSSNEM